MQIQLPPMGRPSLTGLSVKQLGEREYQRRYQQIHRRRLTSRRWWTGLSRKTLTEAKYMAAWRALRAGRQ